MLPVSSVILEYRKDSRNSSDRPTVRPQSLYCMFSMHSHVHLYSFEPYQLQLITEQAFRRAQMLKSSNN